MAKNYMADVANMLGVELEEEFTVPNKVATLKISAKDGLMCKFKDNKNWEYCASYLQELLMGDMEIVKLPWKPKKMKKDITILMFIIWKYSMISGSVRQLIMLCII